MPVIDLSTGKRKDEEQQKKPPQPAYSPSAGQGKRIIDLSSGKYKEEQATEQPGQAPAPIPEGSFADAIFQPIDDVIRGGAGAVAGGLSGLGTLAYQAATGGENPMGAAADTVKNVQDFAMNVDKTQPTQMGQAGSDFVQSLGNAVEDGMSYFPKRLVGAIAGAAELPNGQDAAKQAFQTAATAESGATALGDSLYNATGSPLAGALGQAAYEGITMLGPTKRGQAAAGAEKTAIDNLAAADASALAAAQQGKAPVVSNQVIADNLASGKTSEQLLDLVNADKDFFDAADAVGMNTQAPLSFVTRNAQMRDFAAALESRVGSAAGANKDTFMRELGEKTNQFINKIGESDKSVIDQGLRNAAEQNVNQLYRESESKYDQISNLIDKKERIAPIGTMNFVDQKIAELGGESKLSPQLRRLYAGLKDKGGPTYGFLDYQRKQLGQKIGGGDSIFRDEEKGLAKALYANLTADLDGFAATKGADVQKLLDQAKATTRYRKSVEDNMVTLFGEKLQSSPLTKVYESANRQLTRGDVTSFNKVMQSVPKNARKDVIAATLADVMRGGPNKRGDINPTAYVTWYENMQKNAAARDAFFGYMTPDQRKAANAFYKVSKGAQESFAKTTNNGRILDLFKTESKGMGKLFENAATWLPAANKRRADNQMLTPTARAIRFAGRSLGRMIEGETKRDQMAIDLIASPQFIELVRKSTEAGGVVGKRVEEAEQRLMKSRAYQSWWNTVPLQERKKISNSFIGWMLTEETDPEEEDNAKVR